MGRIRGRREPSGGAADRAGVVPWGVPAGEVSLEPDPAAAARGRAGRRILRWLERQTQVLQQWWGARPARQLRLCETLALGERRFLAVVECGQQKLLIGGAGGSLALLKELSADRGGAQESDGHAGDGAGAPKGTEC